MKSVDTAAAEKIAGVQVVHDGDFVAVLHEFPDVAASALEEIKAEFDVPEAKVDDKNIFDHLLSVAPNGQIQARGGDLDEGRKLAVKKVQTTYLNSYVAHAPMETHTVFAHIEGDRSMGRRRKTLSARAPTSPGDWFPEDKVRVITPLVGGGFGGKTRNLWLWKRRSWPKP
jgi:isoquinoline 1-oxidoreductase